VIVKQTITMQRRQSAAAAASPPIESKATKIEQFSILNQKISINIRILD
jgi:hypothetical protein